MALDEAFKDSFVAFAVFVNTEQDRVLSLWYSKQHSALYVYIDSFVIMCAILKLHDFAWSLE